MLISLVIQYLLCIASLIEGNYSDGVVSLKLEEADWIIASNGALNLVGALAHNSLQGGSLTTLQGIRHSDRATYQYRVYCTYIPWLMSSVKLLDTLHQTIEQDDKQIMTFHIRQPVRISIQVLKIIPSVWHRRVESQCLKIDACQTLNGWWVEWCVNEMWMVPWTIDAESCGLSSGNCVD